MMLSEHQLRFIPNSLGIVIKENQLVLDKERKTIIMKSGGSFENESHKFLLLPRRRNVYF